VSIPFPIFAALDQQWRTFASDADTYTALQRWRHSERVLAGLHSAEEVLACRHEHLRADPILAVLVRRPAANSSSSVRSTSTILVFELRGQPWRSPKLLRTPTVWPSPSPVDVAAVRVPRSGQPTAMGFPRTVAGFYRYTEEEDLLARSPAVHLRRPRLDYESHATGLDRNEVGALLVAAGLASAMEHALVSLLAINGLRVSEALGADIEALASNAAIEPTRSTARAARSSPSRSLRGWPEPSTCEPGNRSKDRSSSAPTGSGWTATTEHGCLSTATPLTSSPPSSPAPPADKPGEAGQLSFR